MTDAERAARLFDMAPKMEWQPIETAPRDDVPFLAFIAPTWIEVMHFSEGHIFYSSDGDAPRADRDLPTHWMPLPAPPVAEPAP